MSEWQWVAEERRAFADLLDSLTAEQWAAPSLCQGWSVRDVVAHVMMGPTGSAPSFLMAMVRARGSFAEANRVLVRDRASLGTDEVTALVRDHAESRFHPPGLGWHAPLTDAMVHREDVAVPLAVGDQRPPERWATVLGFLTSPRARIGFVRGRLPALTYVAGDADWRHGDGPEVTAPARALALAITGRAALSHELSGPGAPALTGWAGGS